MGAAVAGTSFRPLSSYTTLWDVTLTVDSSIQNAAVLGSLRSGFDLFLSQRQMTLGPVGGDRLDG